MVAESGLRSVAAGHSETPSWSLSIWPSRSTLISWLLRVCAELANQSINGFLGPLVFIWVWPMESPLRKIRGGRKEAAGV